MNIKIYQDDLPNNFELEGDIAIDTETMGLNLHRDKLCLLQFSNGNGEAHLVHFVNQDYTAPNLKALLLDKTRCKIFHFARFDLAAIKKYLSIDLENIFCTKISSKLVRTYTDSHGLKDLCRELLNINISKQQQSSYWGTDNLSSEQKRICSKRCALFASVKDILQKCLEKIGLNLPKIFSAFYRQELI